jgi:hypothetical protein
MVLRLRPSKALRYVAKVHDLYVPHRHITFADSLRLGARSDGMKQQSVGALALVVAWAAAANVNAARAQSLEVESEERSVEDYWPLRPGFGRSVALSSDGMRALVGIPGFADPTSPRSHSESWPGAAIVFIRTGETWTQEARLQAERGSFGFSRGRATRGTSRRGFARRTLKRVIALATPSRSRPTAPRSSSAHRRVRRAAPEGVKPPVTTEASSPMRPRLMQRRATGA